MTRSSWNHQRETVIFLLAVLTLFVVLIVRNGGNYYMSYLYQDASRARFEIDQSYVLLISQAEGFQTHSMGIDYKKQYNATLLREFKEKVVQKPTSLEEIKATEKFQGNEVIGELLHGKKDGLFIHCCYSASDTVTKASHLQVNGWLALVMEADLEKYRALTSQKHSFSIAKAVLSTQINSTTASLSKKIQETIENNGKALITQSETQDFPLDFVAKSFGRTSVDWLVLSSRGSEYGILKAILLGECRVHVISTDVNEAIEALLMDNGYTKWRDNGITGIFYNEELVLKTSEKHDMSPLLEKLRRDKMNRFVDS